MADTPPYPDTGDDNAAEHDRESTPGTPRWVKVSGIIAAVLVLLLVVLLLTGNHGPGRHSSVGVADPRPSGATEHATQQQ